MSRAAHPCMNEPAVAVAVNVARMTAASGHRPES
jgi:hypothetical protein